MNEKIKEHISAMGPKYLQQSVNVHTDESGKVSIDPEAKTSLESAVKKYLESNPDDADAKRDLEMLGGISTAVPAASSQPMTDAKTTPQKAPSVSKKAPNSQVPEKKDETKENPAPAAVGEPVNATNQKLVNATAQANAQAAAGNPATDPDIRNDATKSARAYGAGTAAGGYQSESSDLPGFLELDTRSRKMASVEDFNSVYKMVVPSQISGGAPYRKTGIRMGADKRVTNWSNNTSEGENLFGGIFKTRVNVAITGRQHGTAKVEAGGSMTQGGFMEGIGSVLYNNKKWWQLGIPFREVNGQNTSDGATHTLIWLNDVGNTVSFSPDKPVNGISFRNRNAFKRAAMIDKALVTYYNTKIATLAKVFFKDGIATFNMSAMMGMGLWVESMIGKIEVANILAAIYNEGVVAWKYQEAYIDRFQKPYPVHIFKKYDETNGWKPFDMATAIAPTDVLAIDNDGTFKSLFSRAHHFDDWQNLGELINMHYGDFLMADYQKEVVALLRPSLANKKTETFLKTVEVGFQTRSDAFRYQMQEMTLAQTIPNFTSQIEAWLNFDKYSHLEEIPNGIPGAQAVFAKSIYDPNRYRVAIFSDKFQNAAANTYFFNKVFTGVLGSFFEFINKHSSTQNIPIAIGGGSVQLFGFMMAWYRAHKKDIKLAFEGGTAAYKHDKALGVGLPSEIGCGNYKVAIIDRSNFKAITGQEPGFTPVAVVEDTYKYVLPLARTIDTDIVAATANWADDKLSRIIFGVDASHGHADTIIQPEFDFEKDVVKIEFGETDGASWHPTVVDPNINPFHDEGLVEIANGDWDLSLLPGSDGPAFEPMVGDEQFHLVTLWNMAGFANNFQTIEESIFVDNLETLWMRNAIFEHEDDFKSLPNEKRRRIELQEGALFEMSMSMGFNVDPTDEVPLFDIMYKAVKGTFRDSKVDKDFKAVGDLGIFISPTNVNLFASNFFEDTGIPQSPNDIMEGGSVFDWDLLSPTNPKQLWNDTQRAMAKFINKNELTAQVIYSKASSLLRKVDSVSLGGRATTTLGKIKDYIPYQFTEQTNARTAEKWLPVTDEVHTVYESSQLNN